MEDKDILNLWKTQETQLQQTLAVNNRLIQELQAQKLKSALQGLTIKKIAGIGAFMIWLFILGSVVHIAVSHYTPAAIYFIGSVIAIMVINIIGLAGYIRHLMLINTINYNGPVADMQQKLSQLQASIISHVRIMFLQLPFYSTFSLNATLFGNAGIQGWLLQIFITGIFIGFSYWIYRNLHVKNSHKKWFQRLVDGSGARTVARAMEFNRELEEFKN